MFGEPILKACLTVGVLLALSGPGQGQPAGPSPGDTEAVASYEKDMAASSAAVKDALDRVAPEDRVVLIQTLRLEVPTGFCERAGLESGGGPWTLSPREARLFTALLRGEPGMEAISRPTIMTFDGQSARVSIGQTVDLVTGLESIPKDGGPVYSLKTATVEVGNSLRVCPKVADDGKSVVLRVEARHTTLGGTPVATPVTSAGGPGKGGPVTHLHCLDRPVNVQMVETTADVPVGGTAVLVSTAAGQDAKVETLWLLTVHTREAKRATAAPR
jgi:hypothetical protein